MTQPLPQLTPQQLPRLSATAVMRPQVFSITEQETGQTSLLLVIESVNGTFVFGIPLDYAISTFLPLINQAIVDSGGKSQLVGRIVPATLQDLQHIQHINVNGQGGPS